VRFADGVKIQRSPGDPHGFEADLTTQLLIGLRTLDSFFSDKFIGDVLTSVTITFKSTNEKPDIPVRLDRYEGVFPTISIHRLNRRLAPTAIYGICALRWPG
jgi:hypothetical protein